MVPVILAATIAMRSQLSSHPAFRYYTILLAASRFGEDREEQAAFLYVAGDRLAMTRWPGRTVLRASYDGRPPARCLAIAHTHPDGVPATPSPHDIAEARRIGVAIVVVSSEGVTVATPDGAVSWLASGRGWQNARTLRAK